MTMWPLKPNTCFTQSVKRSCELTPPSRTGCRLSTRNFGCSGRVLEHSRHRINRKRSFDKMKDIIIPRQSFECPSKLTVQLPLWATLKHALDVRDCSGIKTHATKERLPDAVAA